MQSGSQEKMKTASQSKNPISCNAKVNECCSRSDRGKGNVPVWGLPLRSCVLGPRAGAPLKGILCFGVQNSHPSCAVGTRGPSSGESQLTLEDKGDIRRGWEGPWGPGDAAVGQPTQVITHQDIHLLSALLGVRGGGVHVPGREAFGVIPILLPSMSF